MAMRIGKKRENECNKNIWYFHYISFFLQKVVDCVPTKIQSSNNKKKHKVMFATVLESARPR